MSIDRDAALKEGKLDGAIEAYVRLVEDRPSDWNPINTLERHGEMARALAVLIELDLDSGGYRDGRARIDRLVRAQAESPDQ